MLGKRDAPMAASIDARLPREFVLAELFDWTQVPICARHRPFKAHVSTALADGTRHDDKRIPELRGKTPMLADLVACGLPSGPVGMHD